MNNKTITLTGDGWDIPEGFNGRGIFKIPDPGDTYFCDIDQEFMLAGNQFNQKDHKICLIPEVKQIDWEKIIDSKVLCEFSVYDDFDLPAISRLEKIEDDLFLYFNGKVMCRTCFARPAQGILFGHDGVECPLPDGVRVKVYVRGDMPGEEGDASGFNWDWNFVKMPSDIVSYEIIGISKGWSY